MAAELQWATPNDASQAASEIAALRKDNGNTDWVYITFAGTSGPASQKLTFGGSGSGGTDALKAHFKDDAICFGLVRINDKVDDSVTVKFVWVNWLGNGVGTMQKARLSTLVGLVKDFFGQSHLTHSCNSQDEISDTILRGKVMATSGTGSKVIDASGNASMHQQVAAGGVAKAHSVAGSKKTADDITFDEAASATLAKVRKDNDPTQWASFTWESPNNFHLVLQASGNGGANEVVSHLLDDKVVYVIIRKIETIDQTEAVKFCYIRWLGENIPRMQRAKLGATAGRVNEFFHPYHVSMDSPDKHEVNDAHIMKLINAASGTAVHVMADDNPRALHQASKPQAQASPAKATAVSQPKAATLSSGAGSSNVATNKGPSRGVTGERSANTSTALQGAITLQDEAGIRAAIQSVRDDADPNDWVLITYTAPKSNTVKLHAAGSGGLASMRTHFKDDVVMYGIVRVTEKIDDTVAVKFCFVDWRGENINRMQRANLGIHSGDVTALLRPYHVDVACSDPSEITDAIIMQKVKNASGTAVHVL